MYISADCQALLIICPYSYIGKEYDTELINVSLFEIVCVSILPPPPLLLLLCLPRLLYNALAAWLETLCHWELPLSFDLSPSFALALPELRLTRPDGFSKTLASPLYTDVSIVVLRTYTYRPYTCRRYFSINECLYMPLPLLPLLKR